MLELSLARRLLGAHRDWVAEAERELASTEAALTSRYGTWYLELWKQLYDWGTRPATAEPDGKEAA